MDIIPNQPTQTPPVRMPGWLRGLLITAAAGLIVAIALAAAYIGFVLLTFDSTGWM